jgi:hypothetical protein
MINRYRLSKAITLATPKDKPYLMMMYDFVCRSYMLTKNEEEVVNKLIDKYLDTNGVPRPVEESLQP